MKNEKSSALSALLNFFIPGLGFLYLGKIMLGFVTFLGIAMLFMMALPIGVVGWLVQIVAPFAINKSVITTKSESKDKTERYVQTEEEIRKGKRNLIIVFGTIAGLVIAVFSLIKILEAIRGY